MGASPLSAPESLFRFSDVYDVHAELYEPAYGDCGDPAGRSCYIGNRIAKNELGELTPTRAVRPGVGEVRAAFSPCSTW